MKTVDIKLSKRFNWNVFGLFQQLAQTDKTDGIKEADDKNSKKAEILESINTKVGINACASCVLVLHKKGIYLIPVELKDSADNLTSYSDLPNLVKNETITVAKSSKAITFGNQHVVDFYNSVIVSSSVKYTPVINITTGMDDGEAKNAIISDGADSDSSETFQLEKLPSREVNNQEIAPSDMSRLKVPRRPKYTVDRGPLSDWLSKESYFLELAGISKERDQVVILTDLLTPELTNGVLSYFKEKQVRNPTIANLKAALDEANKLSGTDYSQMIRNTKWDGSKFQSMTDYYQRLKALTKLSLDEEAEKLSSVAIDKLTTDAFRMGMPGYIKSSEAFDLSELKGPALAQLAQKLLLKRQKSKSEDINYVSYRKPAPTEHKARGGSGAAKQKYAPEKTQKPKPNFSCYYCNIKGHRYQDCYKLKAAHKEGKDKDWKPSPKAVVGPKDSNSK